jgi:hypothetical protein
MMLGNSTDGPLVEPRNTTMVHPQQQLVASLEHALGHVRAVSQSLCSSHNGRHGRASMCTASMHPQAPTATYAVEAAYAREQRPLETVDVVRPT